MARNEKYVVEARICVTKDLKELHIIGTSGQTVVIMPNVADGVTPTGVNFTGGQEVLEVEVAKNLRNSIGRILAVLDEN